MKSHQVGTGVGTSLSLEHQNEAGVWLGVLCSEDEGMLGKAGGDEVVGWGQRGSPRWSPFGCAEYNSTMTSPAANASPGKAVPGSCWAVGGILEKLWAGINQIRGGGIFPL